MRSEISFESDGYLSQPEFAAWTARRTSDLERCELLNGRIVMNPPSAWPQGEVGLTVAAIIRTFAASRRLGRVFGADQGFELPSGDTVAPDAAFVTAARWQASGPHEPGRFLAVVPELVVEVLSPATAARDRGEKKAIYERNGVAEYWLVDAIAGRITRFVLEGGRYPLPRVFEPGARFESAVLAGLAFDVADAFE